MSLENQVTPPGIDPGIFRLVAHRLNHYATPGPFFLYNNSKMSNFEVTLLSQMRDISMNSCQNNVFQKKSCRENQNKHFVFNNFFFFFYALFEIMWKILVSFLYLFFSV
jgi:hypothetical protein